MPNQKLKGWNHIPDVPLRVSPFFTWPLRPMAMLKWLWGSWFWVTEKLIILALATVSFLWATPDLTQMQHLDVSWITVIYLRNLLLGVGVGGALHLWFYTFSAQGQKLKYDPRALMLRGRQFTLGGQLRDNMFWTLGSGVLIWSALEVLLLWALANAQMPLLRWDAHPVYFIAIFLLIPIWESLYFYCIHRLLHVPFLYKHVHHLHHRNINVGPFSGMSMHPVEQLLFLGSVCVHLAIGAHPLHIIFHLQYYFLTALTTHTGFQGLWIKDQNRLALGTFHHQMHHRYFECNYGSLEIPIDKWMGTFHDGTPEANEKMQARRKRIMGER